MAIQHILFFGRLAEQIGRSITLDIAQTPLTLVQLRQLLHRHYPRQTAALASAGVRACIDGVISPEDAVFHIGQEIAFIPPLSGG